MTDFRSSSEFQALMVSLQRIQRVNIAFETAKASERQTQEFHDKRHLEQENKHLSRQLRSAPLCSAYSIAEEVIINLAPKAKSKSRDLNPIVKCALGLPEGEKISRLHTAQYQLQHEAGVCIADGWDDIWSELHRLRKLRNKLMHGGGIGDEDELAGKIDRDQGFRAWIEPMFDNSEIQIFVLVVGELHFRDWLKKLKVIILDIDRELSNSVIGN